MGVITPPRATVAPAIKSSVAHNNEGRDMVSRGQYLYTVAMGGTVAIYDKTNPEALSSPVGTVSSATLLNGAHGIALNAAGTLALVAAQGANRLTVIDVSTPSAPTIVGNVQDNTALNTATDVEVSGNYAFVSATSNNGVAAVDFSTPSAPTVAGSVTSATLLIGPQGIKLNAAGTRLYAGNQGAGSNVGLTCIDVSSAPTMTILGSGSDAGLASVPSAVDIDGNYAYATTSGSANRMDVWEIANLATGVPHNTPIWRASVVNSNLALPLNCRVRDGFVYVPGQSNLGAFSVIDALNPLAPAYLLTVLQPTPGSGVDAGSGELYHNFGCYIDRDYAFVLAHGIGRVTSLKINRNYGEYCEAGNGPRIA